MTVVGTRLKSPKPWSSASHFNALPCSLGIGAGRFRLEPFLDGPPLPCFA
jgi:hypothetical protein